MRIETTFLDMIRTTVSMKSRIVQFFVSSCEKRVVAPIDQEEIQEFLQKWRFYFDQLYIHCSYRINFSSISRRNHPAFLFELEQAKRLSCTHLVLHPGSVESSCVQKNEAIAAFARFLNKMGKKEKEVRFVVENTAGGDSIIGSNLDDFITLKQLLDYPEQLFFCIDTAHAYISGYDLSTDIGQNNFIANIDQKLGLSQIALIHLNDTTEHVGSKNDRHALLGSGLIGTVMLRRFAMHPLLCMVPLIIEAPATIPIEEQKNAISMIQSWHMLELFEQKRNEYEYCD